MQLKLFELILDYFGKPINIEMDKPARWGDVFLMALIRKKEDDVKKKMLNFQISLKIANGLTEKTEIEATPEEFVYLKKVIEESETPLVCGRFNEMYDKA